MADADSKEEIEEKMKHERKPINVVNNIFDSLVESVERLPVFTSDLAVETVKSGAELAEGSAKIGVKITAIVADGTSDAALNQFIETGVKIGSGALLNSLTAKVVTRTGFSAGLFFRSAQSGRFISNVQGFAKTDRLPGRSKGHRFHLWFNQF